MYKSTTQFTPFELVYGTQLVMPTKFKVPTKRIRDIPSNDINYAIHVRMEDLIQLDEECWCVGENINHMKFLRKENWDGKGKIKSFDEGDLVLWMPKTIEIKGGKFRLLWKGPYKVHKTFNNNIVALTTLGDDEVERVNVNKLKEYHSKSVIANVMAVNLLCVEKYLCKYHQNKL
jgi:hypothetical protein